MRVNVGAMTTTNLSYVSRIALGLFVLFFATPRAAVACGGGGVTSASSGVLADTQRIFMSLRASTTEVVVQIGVPATTADYGVLIPVPSQPTLDPQPVAEADLAALDHATAPTIYVETPGDSSEGCGCGAATKDARSVPTGGGGANGVSVSEPVNIGPVEAVVLTGDDGDALAAWLTDHGFALSDEDQATVAAYGGPGTYFIAVRRSGVAADGSPTSIGLHYTLAGAHKKLSLGFARLGAAARVSFTLFLAAPELMGPALPFAALSLYDLDSTLLRAGSYATAVAAAVAARDGKAFVVERAIPATALTGTVGVGLLGLIDDGAAVTRMSTIIAAESLHDDATFSGPYHGDVAGIRVIAVASLPRVHAAAVGLFPMLALAAASLWRRRRRR
jgi:hypothetical protein